MCPTIEILRDGDLFALTTHAQAFLGHWLSSYPAPGGRPLPWLSSYPSPGGRPLRWISIIGHAFPSATRRDSSAPTPPVGQDRVPGCRPDAGSSLQISTPHSLGRHP